MSSYRNTILTLLIYFLIFTYSYGQNVWVDITLANGEVISFKSNDRGLPSRITGFNISKDASNLTENSVRNITGKLLLENQGLMRINVNNIR